MSHQLPSLTPAQVLLVKNTVAADCTDDEFDLFMASARHRGLDPFKNEIAPVVFSKDNPKKRRMVNMVMRDGRRVLAQRCGDYRPASEPATIDYDDALKSATNPKGIVRAVVKLWKRDPAGDWHPVVGEADWDEFAAITDEWAWNDKAGKRQPTGKKQLGDMWAKMPKLMIVKCAEAQALRAGWPDVFGGVYFEEEVARVRAEEETATTIAEGEKERRRMERVKADDAILLDLGGPIEAVPVGQLADRVIEHLRFLGNPIDIGAWRARNEVGLRQFWAHCPGDALELKKAIETMEAAPVPALTAEEAEP